MGCGYSYGYSPSFHDVYYRMSVNSTIVYDGWVIHRMLVCIWAAVTTVLLASHQQPPHPWHLSFSPGCDVEWRYIELSPWKKCAAIMMLAASLCLVGNGTSSGTHLVLAWALIVVPHVWMIHTSTTRRLAAAKVKHVLENTDAAGVHISTSPSNGALPPSCPTYEQSMLA